MAPEVDPALAGAGGEDDDGYSTGQKIRWALALVVAFSGAAYYLIGIDSQVLCHDSLAKGDSAVVDLCGPPGLTELAPFALVIAVLLLPDLSEMGIAGLLSLKRAVRHQGERQEAVEGQLVRLEQSLSQQVAVNQHSPTNLAITLAGEQFDLKTAAAHLKGESGTEEDTDEEEGSGGQSTSPPRKPDGGGDGPKQARAKERLAEGQDADIESWAEQERERAMETQQLLYLAKNLGQYEGISRMRQINPGERMAALTEDQQEMVDRWYALFADEIALVRNVRNTVAHTPYAIDIDELREANRIGTKLLRILLEGLGASTAPVDRFEQLGGADV